MKKFKSILKSNFKLIIGIVIGIVIASTGVYAATTLASSSVAYDNSTSGGTSTNVKGALDELYKRTESYCPDGYKCYQLCKVTSGTGSSIGDQIKCGSEYFRIISVSESSVTMFAQYCLNSSYRQTASVTASNYAVSFSNVSGWPSSGQNEINIQSYSGNAKTYVNEYVSYLQGLTGDSTISGNLITLAQLKSLGCTTSDSYMISGSYDCESSSYSWIDNYQSWWTRSAYNGMANQIWYYYAKTYNSGSFSASSYSTSSYYGIRPTITISKDTIVGS